MSKKIDIKSWAAIGRGEAAPGGEPAAVQPPAFSAPAGYTASAYANIAYKIVPSSGMLVMSSGRMTRADTHKVLLPIPAALHERITKQSSGSAVNAMVGLIAFAVAELERTGSTLDISL